MKSKIEKILVQNFPRLKKIKINQKEDLIKNGLIDSLELMKLISILEKKYKFNFDKYQRKNNNFKLNNLEKYL